MLVEPRRTRYLLARRAAAVEGRWELQVRSVVGNFSEEIAREQLRADHQVGGGEDRGHHQPVCLGDLGHLVLGVACEHRLDMGFCTFHIVNRDFVGADAVGHRDPVPIGEFFRAFADRAKPPEQRVGKAPRSRADADVHFDRAVAHLPEGLVGARARSAEIEVLLGHAGIRHGIVFVAHRRGEVAEQRAQRVARLRGDLDMLASAVIAACGKGHQRAAGPVHRGLMEGLRDRHGERLAGARIAGERERTRRCPDGEIAGGIIGLGAVWSEGRNGDGDKAGIGFAQRLKVDGARARFDQHVRARRQFEQAPVPIGRIHRERDALRACGKCLPEQRIRPRGPRARRRAAGAVRSSLRAVRHGSPARQAAPAGNPP